MQGLANVGRACSVDVHGCFGGYGACAFFVFRKLPEWPLRICSCALLARLRCDVRPAPHTLRVLVVAANPKTLFLRAVYVETPLVLHISVMALASKAHATGRPYRDSTGRRATCS